jgi:hypothetical protein
MPTPLLLAALLLPLQTAKAEATPWETVVSEDGQYSVEMPATPNFRATKSRSSSDGQVRMNIRGCRASGGNYFVQKSEFATNLITGTEDTQLDAERDEFARQYGGTPAGEKKVTLGGAIPGREFTIRGKPKGELGIITVRVREYVVGKKIFAVLVTSIANRELPDDTERFLGSLKLLSGSAVKPTPAPKLAQKPARPRTAGASPSASASGGSGLEAWGTPVDPDGDCKIHPEGDTLVIDVPNKRHDLTPFSRLFNVPRVVRPIEGDFEVQVKVEGEFKPVGPAERPVDEPANGAGLIVLDEGESHVVLHRMAFIRKGKFITSVELAQRSEGGSRGKRHYRLGLGTIYLRLARTGNQILASVSDDGKEWESLETIESLLPDRVKVGVVAINTSHEPFSVTFSEFKLEGK